VTEAVALPGGRSPVYPMLARRRGLEGAGIVRLRISARGDVIEATIARSSGHALLDDAAVEAFATWKFEPRRVNGTAVPGRFEQPFRFRLR
jgi:protein TonB